ncbi:outer membrane beta-barrel protein [Bradyrhizobium prioriisuperbiae]|uniref:outer membrane beta-barrel protein n=1 Tax=Bradyrhizobium prioriisuperbiae TaxID=2854389 RepID=UPI0028EB593E|nr:outer membrane beta-barrel protein [Bradyrhizobium prioritasuperba]
MAPDTGRRTCVHLARALPLCLAALIALFPPAGAQTVNSDLFNPQRDGFAPKNSNLRRTAQTTPGDTGSQTADEPPPAPPAPSRLGKPPTWGTPAASGAGTAATGYDSLGRKKKAATKAKAGTLSGAAAGARVVPGLRGSAPLTGNATLPPVRTGPVPSAPPKITPPPSVTANGIRVPQSLAGTIDGQPPRRRLRVDDDPFGAVGSYYGAFLSKGAIELSGGYDTNPARVTPAKGSAFWMISPELVIASNWERHSLSADLRGSFTGYGSTFPGDISASSGVPTTLDRPDFNGRIVGRIDVDRETRINSELRLRIATDNPGSPNIADGLARYPVFATYGTSLGVDHDFNRLNVSLTGTVDHTSYQWSKLASGASVSNDGRDFTQYGGIARVSYDWQPGVKPFVEVQADTRVHDNTIDDFGFLRDSNGGYIKAGSSFELTRLITGEASVGWLTRSYQDGRLAPISGLLTSASLIWTVTPLTTAKFIATSSIDESPLPFVSGVKTRNYTWEVEHALQRWLVATARFGYGTADYEGLARNDNRYTVSGDLVYKLNRNFQIKGSLRHDWVDSSIPGASTQATVMTLGVRVQQ